MIDRKKFFDTIAKPLFADKIKQSQVDGITHLLDIWEECYAAKYPNLDYLCYALATTYHETAQTMQPIEEYGKGRGRAYGHPSGPWHKIYDGRGDVQLTWEANYKHATLQLATEMGVNVNFEQYPELAMQPDYAAHIMYLGMIDGWFTGRKLNDYFRLGLSDPLHARRIINGLDCAVKIKSYFLILRPALVEVAA